ncbi:hypothetical protein EPN44_15940 [bacterium]|nr:MAG: hypothetical protein EPN44_15940 [bacterium]
MSLETYFSLQGEVWLADRDPATGLAKKTRWAFNAPKLEIALSAETDDVVESFSGNRLLDDQLDKGKSAKVSMTLHGWSLANLALGLYGSVAKITGGAVVDEVLPTGLVAGDFVQLDKRGVSAMTLKDSTAGTPLVPTAANLSIYRPNSGVVQVSDVGAFVQPFLASYTYADADLVAMFSTVAPPERYLVFDGVNTKTGKSVVAELYRIKFSPQSALALINESHGTIELEGVCLYDRQRAADANLGGFGRLVQTAMA